MTPGSARVVDSSVLGLVYFPEPRTVAARSALNETVSLVAPDLVLLELASIGRRAVHSGNATVSGVTVILEQAAALIERLVPARDHIETATVLAIEHSFTVYDAVYLAVASRMGAVLITADARLTRNAEARGLGHLVRLIA